MECPHCRGRLVAGAHTYHVHRHGYHLILDTVPALVCQQCGEPLFEREAIDGIQDMIRALDQEVRKPLIA